MRPWADRPVRMVRSGSTITITMRQLTLDSKEAIISIGLIWLFHRIAILQQYKIQSNTE